MAATASADGSVRIPLELDLDDEQLQLLEATRGFIQRHYPLGDARQVVESERTLDRERWRHAAEMGWIAALAPESAGGLGFNPAAGSVIASELGRGVNWTPFLGCALSASALLDAAGTGSDSERVLGSLVEGETTAAWCGPEPLAGNWGRDTVHATATRRADGYVLDGVKTLVPDADLADTLVVAARDGDQIESFLVPADNPGVTVEVERTLDLTRRFATVRLDEVEVDGGARVPGDGESSFQRTHQLAVVLAAADAVGAAEYLLELTVEYAGDRIAFQRPIASYQAVKHMSADMLLHVEAARAATRYAALALGGNTPDRDKAVAVAGGYTAEATADVAGDALQIHGGVGFTWEHDLHLFLRRIKVDQAIFGDSRWHRELVVRELT